MDDFKPKNLIFFIICIAVGITISFIPAPEGLDHNAMIYLGTFVALLMLMIKPVIPTWMSSLCALAVLAIAKVGTIPVVFSAFSDSIFWLMVAVFAFATAIANCGVLNRLALKLLTVFPKNYRGQVLSLMAAGFVMSPLIPSSMAKVNLLLPMATAMTEQVGYEPRSKPALGLFTAAFMPSYIGCYAFLTGTANVAFLVGVLKLDFSWIGWLSATFIWLIILLVGTFIYCMTYCKPAKKLDLPKGFFEGKLKDLGKISFNEKVAIVVIVCALATWITQPLHGFDAGMVCMVATAVLVLFGVLDTKDFNTKMPWGLLIFIGAFIAFTNLMSPLGISTWLASLLAPIITPVASNVWIFVPALCIITWLLRSFIPAQAVVLISLAAVFSPILPAAGISLFVLGFTEYTVGNIWFNKFQNPLILGVVAVAGNKYVTIDEFRKSAWAYMAIALVALMGSIPLWSVLGLC
ncbi:MAG: SLC13 family permease [Raoultibacter sp.]